MKIFSILFVCAWISGCQPDASAPNPAQASDAPRKVAPKVIKLFGGEQAMAAVLEPDKVQAFKVNSVNIQKGEEVESRIGNYRITAGPVEVKEKEAADLADILAKNIYDWEMAKACEFQPGIAVRFTKSEAVVEVLFCFKCEEMKILLNDKSVGYEDFDRATKQLDEVFRRIF